ncbi:MAG TPA: diadenylate cyclase CdaA [Clostridia bacterium]|nr:diadenylate cyclase CdaA [Clostridia bacterium]
MEVLKSLFEQIIKAVMSFNFLSDVFDVFLVAFLIYNAIKLLRGTRAFLILKAIFIVGVVYAAVSLLNMEASEYIFKILFDNSIIIFLILFSPELRQMLESVGRRSIKSIALFSFKSDADRTVMTLKTINDVCKASASMSRKQCGALIVFEKATPLQDIISTGTKINAESSIELINSIFFKNSALHDGALIIREAGLCAAGCILPLTENDAFDSELGTRHRAALGMSEVSDAAVVVVSEENGMISLACGGELRRGVSTGDLREFLTDYLIETDEESADESVVGRIKNLMSSSKKDDKEEKK